MQNQNLKAKIFLLGASLFSFFALAQSAEAACGNAGQTECYVDGTIAADCNNYIVSQRKCGAGGNMKAYKTIREAVNVANAGDTVQIRAGTYNEFVLIHDKSGNAVDGYITVQNYGHTVGKKWGESGYGEEVIIDHGHSGPAQGYGIRTENSSYLKIQGIIVRNFRGDGIVGGASVDNAGATISHLEIRDNTVYNGNIYANSYLERNADGCKSCSIFGKNTEQECVSANGTWAEPSGHAILVSGYVARRTIDISGITKSTNGAVVTTSTNHGLSDGMEVQMWKVGGMTEINTDPDYRGPLGPNYRSYIVSDATLNTFKPKFNGQYINSGSYASYTGGGIVIYQQMSTYTDVVVDNNHIHDYVSACGEGNEVLTLYWGHRRFQITNNVLENVTDIGINAGGKFPAAIGGGNGGAGTGAYPDGGIIAGNTVKFWGRKGNQAGLYLDGVRNVTIENNIASNSRPACSSLNPPLSATSPTWPHPCDMGGNGTQFWGSGGTGAAPNSEQPQMITENIIIRNNIIRDASSGIGIGGGGGGNGGTETNHIRVAHNDVILTKERNSSFLLAAGKDKKVKNNISYIADNIVYGDGSSANNNKHVGTVAEIKMCRNTQNNSIVYYGNNCCGLDCPWPEFKPCERDLCWHWSQSEGNHIHKEIITSESCAASGGAWKTKIPNAECFEVDRSADLDYNLYYPASRGQDNLFSYRVNGSVYAYKTFSEWQAAGHDTNGRAGDPKFVDPATNNYRLQLTSPAKDAGGCLTTVKTTGSGTMLIVNDAHWFNDGYGIAGRSGDVIDIGSAASKRRVRVKSRTNPGTSMINHGSGTITLSEASSWTAGECVTYAYNGNLPDIGAYEYQENDAAAPASPSGLRVN